MATSVYEPFRPASPVKTLKFATFGCAHSPLPWKLNRFSKGVHFGINCTSVNQSELSSFVGNIFKEGRINDRVLQVLQTLNSDNLVVVVVALFLLLLISINKKFPQIVPAVEWLLLSFAYTPVSCKVPV